MKIGDLFVTLGIKVNQQAITRFNNGLKTISKDLVLVQAAFVGATVAIDRFVDGTVKGSVALQNISNQTGLAIEELERFQQAGQLADLTLSPEAIAQSVGSLQKNLANIRLGQGNLRPFQLLGIDPTGDAFDVIDQLRDAIKGLDPAIATNLIQELGLSPQFINILKLSRQEFEKLGENTFLSAKQRNLVIKAGTAMTNLKLRIKALKDQAVAKLAPSLIELVERFFKWLDRNGGKVIDTITGISRAFSRFVTAVVRAVDFTADLIENIFGVENGIKVVIATLGLLSIAMLPFKRLTGIFVLLALVLEDIAVWARGGESLFGELFEAFNKLPNLAKIFGGTAIAAITAQLTGLTGAVISLSGALTKLAPLGAVIASLGFLFKSPEIGRNIAEKIDETDFLGLRSLTERLTGTSEEQVTSGLLTPRAREIAGQTTNNINVTNNIDGAQDPANVAREAFSLDSVQAQFNNGGS